MANDRYGILEALEQDLVPKGYFVKGGDWICCQSCGWAAVEGEGFNDAVFWHGQDDEAFDVRGRLGKRLHLAWSGDGHLIVDCLIRAGYQVEWNGDADKRIMINPTTSSPEWPEPEDRFGRDDHDEPGEEEV